MRNVYESLNKASISKYLLNKAMLYSLALLFIAAQGCSSGSDAVDKFLGDAEVPDPEVTYSLDLDPATHDFGLVLTVDPVPKTQVVTVKNTMTVPLFISSVVGDASADFTLLNETCSATMVGGLLPSQTCTFTVQFDPTTAGNLAYSVNINFGPAATDTTSVARGSFLGTGATPANLLVSESPLYDFGAVVMTGFAEKTLMITNLGTWPATTVVGDGLSAPFSYKGGVYPGVGGTCGATIGGSASCSIVIEFNPPATGLSTDTIEVSYFDGDQNQVSTRDIQGTGATPAS